MSFEKASDLGVPKHLALAMIAQGPLRVEARAGGVKVRCVVTNLTAR
ncbi:MAG: hypothetical protein WCO00_09295 [Rhodospirillaceae bacterium]